MIKRFLFVIYTLITPVLYLKAQESDSSTTKKVLLLPVPAIGKSLETGWYFGAVCLFKFKNYFRTPQYSTAKAEVNYTLNKQIILNASWFVYTHENKNIIIGDNSFLYFPENFYGIGNNTTASGEIYYTAKRTELYNAVLWKIKPPIYAGVSTRIQGITSVNITGTKTEINRELETNNAGWVYGIGPHLLIDKRDRILNPSAGSYLIDAENINFLKEKNTQGTSAFSNIKTDIRLYHKLFSNTILAWQYYGLYTFGNPPYRLTGLMGSDSHMRGYYQGRYRDNNYATVQAEARVSIKPWIGFTIFSGVGEVWRKAADVSIDTIKYTTGIGFRLRVDKSDQINLRLDYAIGKETSGFYVAFGEAF